MNQDFFNEDFATEMDVSGEDANLTICFYDVSSSMNGKIGTSSKVEVLKTFGPQFFEKLAKGGIGGAFNMSLATFNSRVSPMEHEGKKTYPISKAIELFNQENIVASGGTSFNEVFRHAIQVMDDYANSNPDSTAKTTIILMTDGQSSFDENLLLRLQSHVLSPSVAVLGFGLDVSQEVAFKVATAPTDEQVSSLQKKGLDHMLINPNKLYLRVHDDLGNTTAEMIDSARNLLAILSRTVGN